MLITNRLQQILSTLFVLMFTLGSMTTSAAQLNLSGKGLPNSGLKPKVSALRADRLRAPKPGDTNIPVRPSGSFTRPLRQSGSASVNGGLMDGTVYVLFDNTSDYNVWVIGDLPYCNDMEANLTMDTDEYDQRAHGWNWNDPDLQTYTVPAHSQLLATIYCSHDTFDAKKYVGGWEIMEFAKDGRNTAGAHFMLEGSGYVLPGTFEYDIHHTQYCVAADCLTNVRWHSGAYSNTAEKFVMSELPPFSPSGAVIWEVKQIVEGIEDTFSIPHSIHKAQSFNQSMTSAPDWVSYRKAGFGCPVPIPTGSYYVVQLANINGAQAAHSVSNLSHPVKFQ